jgi:hypothetical protein
MFTVVVAAGAGDIPSAATGDDDKPNILRAGSAQFVLSSPFAYLQGDPGGGRGGRPDAVAGAAGLYVGGGSGYGTAVGKAVTTAGAVHGFPAVRTSFIGRAGPVREVAVLLERYRLVTVTGPGGSGKTRLASQVAR